MIIFKLKEAVVLRKPFSRIGTTVIFAVAALVATWAAPARGQIQGPGGAVTPGIEVTGDPIGEVQASIFVIKVVGKTIGDCRFRSADATLTPPTTVTGTLGPFSMTLSGDGKTATGIANKYSVPSEGGDQPWPKGTYKLSIRAFLEDSNGNLISSPDEDGSWQAEATLIIK